VKSIFARIAGTYDLINALGSFGMDRRWRRAVVRLAALDGSSEVLDLCAGTGDLTLTLARRGRPARVVSTDFVEEMLAIGREKASRYSGETTIEFETADAQDLPFADGSFDVATVAFGVRNLPDRPANFRETHRVLRPGGRYLVLEFAEPTSRLFRPVYHWYLGRVMPWLGGLVSRDREAYQYLNDSVRAFPSREELAAELAQAGFASVRWEDLTFGIVAVHVCTR
jgi:demethylmenaquinone methyltransferase/2-methoxy-6-polyprenyl-1,4-benzoquinol methylase